jgi:hypothetical protein
MTTPQTAREKLLALMASKKASMKKLEKTAKLENGDNRVVLLPGWRGEEDPTWWHDFGQHFIKDHADQMQAVYICTNATFERPCEVCAALANAGRAAGDDLISETLEKGKASRSVLINALMLDSKEPNKPVILEIKRGLFEQLLGIAEEYEGAPLDPEVGMIIKINRDGKGLNTRYNAMPTAKTHKVDKAVLEKINNLDEYVKQESEENLRRAIGSVNTVAGIAAPSADRPSTTPTQMLNGPADDLDDLPPATPAQRRAAAAGGAATPAPAPAMDADLDDLLTDLPD